MATRIPWDKYETALLIDAYVSAKKSGTDRKNVVQSVSNCLRQRAILSGMTIDEIYRNQNGIDMRLHEIGYLFGDESGLKNTSGLFAEMVHLYQYNKNHFNQILYAARLQLAEEGPEDEEYYIHNTANNIQEKSKEQTILKKKEEPCQQNKELHIENRSGEIHDVLFNELSSRNLKYVDARGKKGCLWIIYNEESSEFIEEMRTRGVFFTFSSKGGHLTDGQSAWWTKDIIPVANKLMTESVQFTENPQYRIKIKNIADNKKNLIISICDRECDVPCDISFGELLNANAAAYSEVEIDKMRLPVRCINILSSLKIQTVGQLLETEIDKLISVKGFGNTSLTDIMQYLQKIVKKDNEKKINTLNLNDHNIDPRSSQSEVINPIGNFNEDNVPIINPEFLKMPIEDLDFSTRAYHLLRRAGIAYVHDLIGMTGEQLSNIPGLGKKVFDEINVKIKSIKTQSGKLVSESLPSRNISDFLVRHISEIAYGNYEFANKETLSDLEKEELEKIKEIQNILGVDMTKICVDAPHIVADITLCFREFVEAQKCSQDIMKCLESLPLVKRTKSASGYINAFTKKDDQREILNTIYENSDKSNLEEIQINTINKHNYFLVKAFLEWCKFDITQDIEKIFSSIYIGARDQTIITYRAQKKTLNQIGDYFNLTRERVRQIENKVKRKFAYRIAHNNIIGKINAELNNQLIISLDDLESVCKQHLQEFVYLLQTSDNLGYTYDKSMNSIIIGGNGMRDRVLAFVESLPDVFESTKVNSFYDDAEAIYGLPTDAVDNAIDESFQLSGQTYHRNKLSLKTIYTETIKRHYPLGLHIYDPVIITEVREHIKQDFGDVDLPINDRALTARIASFCILCGRGKYRLKQKEYIPKQLVEKIHEYIVNSKYDIFMINTLFVVFENDLREYGVDNKYYLQGILHEIFDDEFVFTRDYISKDSGITSIYSSIVSFIKESDYPVSKEQINKEFPGVPEIAINIAVDKPYILNFFGMYLHASHLQISIPERNYLEKVLRQRLADNQPHHASEFYDLLIRECPEILSRNGAQYPFSAFSILEYYFRAQYQFSRPYIARKHVQIGRPNERLRELVLQSDECTITQIKTFEKNNHFVIQCMLDYLLSYNDNFFLVNRNKIVRIKKLGLNKEIGLEVDKIIRESINSTMPIHQLMCINKLPTIKTQWTEWLIYSVIKKWGTLTEVATSCNQLKSAVPYIAPKGKMIKEEMEENSTEQQTWMVADDLDNIDDLVGDLLSEEEMSDELWDSKI